MYAKKNNTNQLISANDPLLNNLPGGSDGKVSACNVGDRGSISGSGTSPGEENGNPLQHSCLDSDDHYTYYCVQESLRRNRIALIVNK